MKITHEEARNLIQFSIDKALTPQQLSTLQIHLDDCIECKTFAEELKEVEDLLVPAMLRNWNLRPVPLSIATITEKRKPKLQPSLIMVTRTAILSLVFAAFIFTAWRFSFSAGRTATPMPISILPIPTPSGQSTSTKISFTSCEEMVYRVQQNDTLERIALQFSVSKEKIIASNNLSAAIIHTGMELLIPVCTSTPTGTVHPAGLTITFTPLTRPTTSTPSG